MGQPFMDLLQLASVSNSSSSLLFKQPEGSDVGAKDTLHWQVTANCAIELHAKPLSTGRPGRPVATKQPVTATEFKGFVDYVKEEISAAALSWCTKLQGRFPPSEHLEALAIASPQYHVNSPSADVNDKHLLTLIKQYGHTKCLEDGNNAIIHAIIDAEMLREQQTSFSMAAVSAAH